MELKGTGDPFCNVGLPELLVVASTPTIVASAPAASVRGIGGRGGKGLLRAQRRLYLVASACAVQRTLMPRPTMADNQSTIRRGWALCCGSLGRVTSVLCGRGRDGSRLQQQLAE
ncbi:uncharacterized protein [Triticum aestivum]|uniref:uncharacterized protein n=1 Tax=Triticum aestivum TaxID=4565 RepID=UPI001D033B48|nr:uncharacterized protein LOC123066550 [Triticum aestivum]